MKINFTLKGRYSYDSFQLFISRYILMSTPQHNNNHSLGRNAEHHPSFGGGPALQNSSSLANLKNSSRTPTSQMGQLKNKRSRDGGIQHYSEKNLQAPPNWDIPAAPPLPPPKKKRTRYQKIKEKQREGENQDTDDDLLNDTKQLLVPAQKQSLKEFIDNILQMEACFSQDNQSVDGINRGGDDLALPSHHQHNKSNNKLTLEAALLQSSFMNDDSYEQLQIDNQKSLGEQTTSSPKKYLKGGGGALHATRSTAVLLQKNKQLVQKALNKQASIKQINDSKIPGLESRSLSLERVNKNNYVPNSQLDSSVVIHDEQDNLESDSPLRSVINMSKQQQQFLFPQLPQYNSQSRQIVHDWTLVKPQNLVFGGSTNLKISINPPTVSSSSLDKVKMLHDQNLNQSSSKKHLYKNGGILNSLLDEGKNAYVLAAQSPHVTIFSGKQIPIPASYLPTKPLPFLMSNLSPQQSTALMINPKSLINHTMTTVKSQNKLPPKAQKKESESAAQMPKNIQQKVSSTDVIPRMTQPAFSDVQKKAFRIKKNTSISPPPQQQKDEKSLSPKENNTPRQVPYSPEGQGKNTVLLKNQKIQKLMEKSLQELDQELLQIKSFKKSTLDANKDDTQQSTPQQQLSPKLPSTKKQHNSTMEFTKEKMGMRGTPLGLELGQGAQMKMLSKKYKKHHLLSSSSHTFLNKNAQATDEKLKTHLTVSMTLPLIGRAYRYQNTHQSPDQTTKASTEKQVEENIQNSLIPQPLSISYGQRGSDTLLSPPALYQGRIKQPTSSLTLASNLNNETAGPVVQKQVHFSESVEVYTSKQFAPGPTPPTVIMQKKKLKDRNSLTSLKKILFQEEDDQSLQPLAIMPDGELPPIDQKKSEQLERHQNDMKRIQALEAMRIEEFNKKNLELQENMAKQQHRNMNHERMKLIMSFINKQKEEQEQKKIDKPNLIKFSKELDQKYSNSASKQPMSDMEHIMRTSHLSPIVNHKKQQQNEDLNKSNVKYKLNIRLV